MRNKTPLGDQIKHAMLMLLCCLVPFGILAVMWALGVGSSYLILGVVLLCPVSHLIMMRGRHNNGDGGNHGSYDNDLAKEHDMKLNS